MVNLTGSLLSGFLSGLALYHAIAATPKAVLVTGFCGSYTTVSTFAFETARLVQEGAIAQAALNIPGTVVTCAAAAGLGFGLASV